MRGIAVSFLAGRLNDETKKPIKILRALNVRSWNNETNRFFNELINDTVALSGMRFFYLSRKLILAVSKKKAEQNYFRTIYCDYISNNFKFTSSVRMHFRWLERF